MSYCLYHDKFTNFHFYDKHLDLEFSCFTNDLTWATWTCYFLKSLVLNFSNSRKDLTWTLVILEKTWLGLFKMTSLLHCTYLIIMLARTFCSFAVVLLITPGIFLSPVQHVPTRHMRHTMNACNRKPIRHAEKPRFSKRE